MAMKETERSLRIYFLIAGVFMLVSSLRDVSVADHLHGLRADQSFALYFPIVTRLLLGLGFFIAGLTLKTALPAGAAWIKKLLVASGALLFVNGALTTAEFPIELATGALIGAGVGLAITIYLHRSVTRLAAEAAARSGVPPPPPTAKVV